MSHTTCTCGARISNVGLPSPEIGELVRADRLAWLHDLPRKVADHRSLVSDAERFAWAGEATGGGQAWVRSLCATADEATRLVAERVVEDAFEPLVDDAWLCASCGRVWLQADPREPLRPFAPTDAYARLRFPRWPAGQPEPRPAPVFADRALVELACACGHERRVTGELGPDLAWLRPCAPDFRVESRLVELLALWMHGPLGPGARRVLGAPPDDLGPRHRFEDLLVALVVGHAWHAWRLAWSCERCGRLWVQRYAGARAWVSCLFEGDGDPVHPGLPVWA